MTGRRFRVLLAGSLLVNVFLAGAVIGGLAVLLRQEPRQLPAALLQRPIRAAGHGLPLPDRRRFRQLMAQTLRDSHDLLEEARRDRQTAALLFVQPRFDAGAAAAALQQARDADLQLRARLEAAAVLFAAGLPAVERAVLAEGLSRGGPLRHPAQENPRPGPAAAPGAPTGAAVDR